MLKRKIYEKLKKWKETPNRKALVIDGQRQVGKTYIVREFAKNEYENTIEINFSMDHDKKIAFDGSLRADNVIKNLMAFFPPEKFVPCKTLLFFDEIQDCPPAWASLKSFTEDGKYDVIASGSGLGIQVNFDHEVTKNTKNTTEVLLPTGYQTFLTMKPLDFEEFLWAYGISEDIIGMVITDLSNRHEVSPAFHKRFTDLFTEYLLVGGMPEVVDSYVLNKNYRECDAILKDLVMMSHQDMNRYNKSGDKIKTAECFDSIPKQLANTNKKFMYSRIDSSYSRKSAENIWIICYG